MSEVVIGQLYEAVIGLDDKRAQEVARLGLASGVEPLAMINEGIRSALDLLGERFAAGDLFLPELMLAAQAAEAAVQVLEPEMVRRGGRSEKLGKVLMATVKGDIHDIGKNIVTLLLKAAGFEVVDIGVDRSGEEILRAAREHSVQVIGLSALLTTTMPRMKEFIDLLEEGGIRERYKVLVGGAPVSPEFAEAIGADGYGADATHAVELAKKMVA